jgi:hypothetical protein
MTNPPDDERELVERVAMAIADADTFMYPIGTKCPHVAQARAAIAVVLEALSEFDNPNEYELMPNIVSDFAERHAINPKER